MVRNIPTVQVRTYEDDLQNQCKNGRSGGAFADMGRIPTYGMAIQTAQVAQCEGFGGIGRYGAGYGTKNFLSPDKELRHLHADWRRSVIKTGESQKSCSPDKGWNIPFTGSMKRGGRVADHRDFKPLLFLDLQRFSNRTCTSVFASPYQH